VDTHDSAPDLARDAASAALAPWPGDQTVATVDQAKTFGKNLSGLTYQPAGAGKPAILWAVQNGPSRLFRLEGSGDAWKPATGENWGAGKDLRYPGGKGMPDTEGVTKAEWDSPAVYAAVERDNGADGSRLGVLRFDTSAAGTTLTATQEWNLTADLPSTGANEGLEAITWIPDSYLVGHQFLDEKAGQPYDPARYPGHGTGLFFVGLESNGMIYVYALEEAGAFHRLAAFASGHAGIMGLEFDRDVGALWAACDDTCDNREHLFGIDTAPGSATRGRFQLRRRFAAPTSLGKINGEGIAIAPEAECTGGLKSFFWADDNETDDHALRRGTVRCGDLF
jgi:hypothetical protein